MNKKVLSAILFSALFVGTGTFTSCIDTDEPEGIEQLRGAKAELIRAKVAVEATNAAHVQAEAALKLALSKIEVTPVAALEAGIAANEAQFVTLKADVEGAEDAVIDVEKLVADAEMNLQLAKDGKYDAVAAAQRKLDAANAAMEKAMKEYNEALTNLETALAIMAGETAE